MEPKSFSVVQILAATKLFLDSWRDTEASTSHTNILAKGFSSLIPPDLFYRDPYTDLTI